MNAFFGRKSVTQKASVAEVPSPVKNISKDLKSNEDSFAWDELIDDDLVASKVMDVTVNGKDQTLPPFDVVKDVTAALKNGLAKEENALVTEVKNLTKKSEIGVTTPSFAPQTIAENQRTENVAEKSGPGKAQTATLAELGNTLISSVHSTAKNIASIVQDEIKTEIFASNDIEKHFDEIQDQVLQTGEKKPKLEEKQALADEQKMPMQKKEITSKKIENETKIPRVPKNEVTKNKVSKKAVSQIRESKSVELAEEVEESKVDMRPSSAILKEIVDEKAATVLEKTIKAVETEVVKSIETLKEFVPNTTNAELIDNILNLKKESECNQGVQKTLAKEEETELFGCPEKKEIDSFVQRVEGNSDPKKLKTNENKQELGLAQETLKKNSATKDEPVRELFQDQKNENFVQKELDLCFKPLEAEIKEPKLAATEIYRTGKETLKSQGAESSPKNVLTEVPSVSPEVKFSEAFETKFYAERSTPTSQLPEISPKTALSEVSSVNPGARKVSEANYNKKKTTVKSQETETEKSLETSPSVKPEVSEVYGTNFDAKESSVTSLKPETEKSLKTALTEVPSVTPEVKVSEPNFDTKKTSLTSLKTETEKSLKTALTKLPSVTPEVNVSEVFGTNFDTTQTTLSSSETEKLLRTDLTEVSTKLPEVPDKFEADFKPEETSLLFEGEIKKHVPSRLCYQDGISTFSASVPVVIFTVPTSEGLRSKLETVEIDAGSLGYSLFRIDQGEDLISTANEKSVFRIHAGRYMIIPHATFIVPTQTVQITVTVQK